MIKIVLLALAVFTINGCAFVNATLNTIGVQINGDEKTKKCDELITGVIYITNGVTIIDDQIYNVAYDKTVDLAAFDWMNVWIIGKKIKLNGKNILLILHAEGNQIGQNPTNKD